MHCNSKCNDSSTCLEVSFHAIVASPLDPNTSERTLLCSRCPQGIQCMGLGYRLHTTIIQHIYHSAGGLANIGEVICHTFSEAEAKHKNAQAIFSEDKATAVKATPVQTSHDNFANWKSSSSTAAIEARMPEAGSFAVFFFINLECRQGPFRRRNRSD